MTANATTSMARSRRHSDVVDDDARFTRARPITSALAVSNRRFFLRRRPVDPVTDYHPQVIGRWSLDIGHLSFVIIRGLI